MECDKSFREEWKINAHTKVHKKYPCDQCSKTFQYESIKQKHIKIAHENLKLYCYFYNNNQQCPNGEECVFLHEDSAMCKYMKNCEREYCMYKHKDDHEIAEEIDGNTDEPSEEDVDDDDIHDAGENDDDDNETDKTFYNPSQSDGSESDEEKKRKCDLCTFETEDKKRFKRHIYESHSVKGKYACMHCKQQFESRKLFNNHKYFAH